MPSDKANMAELRPGREQEKVERGRFARVDDERGHAREGVAEALGKVVRVGGGGRAEQRVAPRREERQVEVRDVREAGRDQVEVTRDSPEREGGARPALEAVEAPANKRERVPRPGITNPGEHLQQDLLRQVPDGGFSRVTHRR